MSGFTEDHLIEQPAIQLMEHELGWDSVNAYDEWTSGVSSLGREAKREVVLTGRLKLPAGNGFLLGWPPRSAVLTLQSLNPELPAEALDAAVEELTRDRSALSLVEANREIDKLLRGGVKVKSRECEQGGQRTEVGHVQSRAPRDGRVVDWEILPMDAGGFPGSRKNRAKTGRSAGLGFHRAVKRPIRVKSLRFFTEVTVSRKRESDKNVKQGLHFTENRGFMHA